MRAKERGMGQVTSSKEVSQVVEAEKNCRKDDNLQVNTIIINLNVERRAVRDLLP